MTLGPHLSLGMPSLTFFPLLPAEATTVPTLTHFVAPSRCQRDSSFRQ